MGFFEKVKNMFTEEVEDDDVRVEKIQKEVTRVAIKPPTIEEEELEEDSRKYVNEVDTIDNTDDVDDIINETKEEKKPIFFDDNDFKDLNLETRIDYRERMKESREFNNESKDEKTEREKKVFKPTPIISPVYGVLDKNYHKEDIVSRTDVKEEQSVTESPIDAIRNKAYGTLEDELENTLFGSNSILFKKDESKKDVEIKEVDDDILSDLTDDISKELDELIIKKEKYIDDSKVEEKETEKVEDKEEKEVSKISDDEDLLGFIDSTLYKDGEE